MLQENQRNKIWKKKYFFTEIRVKFTEKANFTEESVQQKL